MQEQWPDQDMPYGSARVEREFKQIRLKRHRFLATSLRSLGLRQSSLLLMAKVIRDGCRPSSKPTKSRRIASADESATQERASMPAFVMNYSTGRSSTRCEKLRSSLKAGVGTITQSASIPRSAPNHPHRRSSCPHSLLGQLRYVVRLRRPPWRNRQLSANISPGPLNVGCSKSLTASDPWRATIRTLGVDPFA